VKKGVVVFAILLLAAPAVAADWSFYGSERMATFYTYQDFGKTQVAGQDNVAGDDEGYQWYVGAKWQIDL